MSFLLDNPTASTALVEAQPVAPIIGQGVDPELLALPTPPNFRPLPSAPSHNPSSLAQAALATQEEEEYNTPSNKRTRVSMASLKRGREEEDTHTLDTENGTNRMEEQD